MLTKFCGRDEILQNFAKFCMRTVNLSSYLQISAYPVFQMEDGGGKFIWWLGTVRTGEDNVEYTDGGGELRKWLFDVDKVLRVAMFRRTGRIAKAIDLRSTPMSLSPRVDKPSIKSMRLAGDIRLNTRTT
ncbi:hypothetical protein EDB85DRAFT_1898292 [Lactarius pseudohatsudake]|nr:hypothetical protein EDB85DRAFT_1898292 [Lactarius pseudohatsudake]